MSQTINMKLSIDVSVIYVLKKQSVWIYTYWTNYIYIYDVYCIMWIIIVSEYETLLYN